MTGDGSILDGLLASIEAGRKLTPAERQELNEKRVRWHRWRTTTQAWLGKAVYLATGGFGHEDRRYVLAYEYSQLLDAVLEAADDLVRHAPEEAELDEALRAVERTRRRLRDLEQAAKLADTSGRTPAEAAVFTKRAETLRERARR